MEGWWAFSYVVLWLVVVALAILVVALARQIGTLHLRLGPRGALEMDDEGPGLGEAPQPIDLSDLDGRDVSIGGPGEAQLLLFVSPGCHVCQQVLPSVGAVGSIAGMTPYVITDIDEHETRRSFDPGKVPARVVAGREVVESYLVPGTPYVVVLDDLGIVRAKGTVNNLEQMEGLIDTAKRRMSEAGPRRTAS